MGYILTNQIDKQLMHVEESADRRVSDPILYQTRATKQRESVEIVNEQAAAHKYVAPSQRLLKLIAPR